MSSNQVIIVPWNILVLHERKQHILPLSEFFCFSGSFHITLFSIKECIYLFLEPFACIYMLFHRWRWIIISILNRSFKNKTNPIYKLDKFFRKSPSLNNFTCLEVKRLHGSILCIFSSLSYHLFPWRRSIWCLEHLTLNFGHIWSVWKGHWYWPFQLWSPVLEWVFVSSGIPPLR